MALRDHHAGDSKYRAILKARTNLLTNIKWNARQNSKTTKKRGREVSG